MNQRRKILLGLLGLVMLLTVFNGTVLTQEYSFKTVSNIISSTNTKLSNPAVNLIDDDPATFWRLQPGSDQGWVELNLDSKVLIHGLQISGDLPNNTELTVEYWQEDKWIRFMAGTYQSLPLNGLLDLSSDRAVTKRLRVRLTGAGVASAGLSAVKVIGEEAKEILYRINPRSVEASGHTSYVTRAEFLTDRNTYTYWMVKPRYRSGENWLFETLERYLGLEIDYNYDFNWPNCPSYYNRGEVVFELGETQSISNINIFYSEDARGELRVEAEENGYWREIGYLPAEPRTGWTRLALAHPVITAQIRLVMAGTGHESVGGISEVEFWGAGKYNGHQHTDLGPQSAQPLTTAVNRKFDLKKEEAKDHLLHFVISPEGGAGPTLAVELNGQEYAAIKAVDLNGQAIYRLKLMPEMLDNEANYLRIESQPGTLTGLKLTSAGDGEELQGLSALADGLLLTRGPGLSEPLLDLGQKLLVEEVEVYTGEAAWMNLYYRDESNWVAVDGAIVTPGCVRFKTPFTTDRIKIANPSQVSLNEVRVLGSAVTDHAPVVRLISPTDYEVFDTDQLSDKHLIGLVDNPRAKVTVNGKEPFQIGHYFGFHLTAVGINTWEDTVVEAVAVDPEGRVGKDRIHMIIDKLPWVTLDQPEKTAFTDSDTYEISGEVRKPHCQLKINGRTVTDRQGRFSTRIPLVEGFNLIKIECVYVKPGNESNRPSRLAFINRGGNAAKDGFTQTFHRKVVRYSGQPVIEVNSPLDGSWLSAASVLVTGKAYGLGEINVWVNEKPALVAGENFRLPVSVAEGKNDLNIRIKDAGGKTANSSLVVWRDTVAPAISITQPTDRSISSSATVTVSGKVTDAFPACITVNGAVARIDEHEFTGERKFTADITLEENWNFITIKAWDTAGNGAEERIEVLVDTETPLPFTVTAEPNGWTSNTRPVLTFETTDVTSGVSHYLLSVDSGAFTQVASPYQLPTQADGEHVIVVKAIDRAGWETESSVQVYIDTTPPVAAPNFRAVPGDDKVILRWEPSPDHDIVKYVVNRVPAFESKAAKELTPEVVEYIDTEVQNLQSYTYSIYAVDHAANRGITSTSSAVQPGLAEVVAEPTAETTVEYENVLVGVPRNALGEARTITITQMDRERAEPLLEKSYALNVSPVYCLSAKTAEGPVDPNGVRFEKPVLVGIKYNLEDEYSILKESNLRAYYYNYKANNWEIIPESYVDGENDTVYFFTKHFSLFSVQASVAAPVSPEQISNMGISPGKSYYQNNQVSISYGGGTASVTAKDFVLPGRGGLDLTISRTYDSGLAQSDWGIDEENIFQAACGFIDFGNAYFNAIANLISAQLDRYLSEPGGSCGFGRGWRMNFVWVEKNENGQFLHLPGGSMKKINWTMDGPGWGGQGHGVFACHAGEHFTLAQTQEFVEDIYSNTNIKTGENWRTTGYTLITKDGTEYLMEGSGKLTKIVNRLGTSEINFYYNEDEKLDYIIDSVGRRIDFSYHGDFVSSISGAGKTVNYYYNDGLQELERVVDGGLHETRYSYTRESLRMGAQTVSLISIVTNILSHNWIGLFSSLLPVERSDEVYYLDTVTTPFDGEYKITYDKYNAIRYGEVFAGYSIMGYEFCKATRLQELGSAYNKDVIIEYNLTYNNDEPPMVFTCDLIEGRSPSRPDGRKRTHMLFDRYSNSVDKDTSMLKMQTVYGEDGRVLSVHLLDEFDKELAAPTRVIDRTGGRNTVQEFAYDNWGNVVWQKNSHTKVEAFYTYANTNAPPLNQEEAIVDPYGSQKVDGNIHDAKTGELILNYNGAECIPQQTAYKYETNGNLLEKAVRSENAWPLKTKYEYDEYGNIVKMVSPSGVETYYEYSPAYRRALLTKVTLNKLTDADHRVQNNVTLKELGYNPITSRKRWEKEAGGFVTEYQYDPIGREIMTVLPDDNDDPNYRPTVLSGEIDRSGARSDNPVRQVIFKDGARTATVIDPLDNRTDYVYDSFEHLVEVVKFKKRSGAYYAYSRVKVGYDNDGNIAKIISPEGNAHPELIEKYTTTYQYDEQNRLTKIEYPRTNDDEELKPCKVYLYNDQTNEVTVLDENNNETIVRKDPVGRVIEEISGSRSAEEVSVKYTYDSLGNKTAETIDDTITTRFEYNDQNQLVRKILPREKVLNDPDGRPVEKSPVYRYEYDIDGNLIKEISPLGRVITHVYDELNREIATRTEFTKLDGTKIVSVTNTYYDLAGNKTKVVDPNGKTTEFTYTAQNLPATQKDPMGGISSFKYDKVGNKISETDPRGNLPGAAPNSYTAWYYYDELYRVVKGVLPDTTPPADPSNPGDNPVMTFDYDRNGNCIKETKANGQEVNYTYNGRNWVDAQSQTLDGTTYTTRFLYDGMGNKRFVFDNKGNKTEYKYDALNRLELEIYPEENTVEYEYDNRGNKRIIRDGKHNETTYIYNKLNLLHKVIDSRGNTTTNWYNEEGQMTKTVSPTGLVTKFYPNEIGLPLTVEDSLGPNKAL